jgi:hypothetical protein
MTLKVTRPLRLTVIAATTLMVAVFAGLASAGSAVADHAWGSEPPTLNGDWAPFNRCPVDDPAMLATEGTTTEAVCVAETTPSGSLTIGSLTVALKGTDHQYGVILSREALPSPGIAPPGGVLVAEPVELPGGIQELICPSSGRFTRHICRNSHNRRWNDHAEVTLTLESAGAPSNFLLFASLVPGTPIATVPLKIHLRNRFLGDDCYIGTEAEPIVTLPASPTPPEAAFLGFDPNGTPDQEAGKLLDLQSHGGQGSSSFAVPAASGCGGFLDQAIDNKVGLPSAATTNNVTFNEGTSNLAAISNPEAVVPNDGRELSNYWHSAVVPPKSGGHGSGHNHDGDNRHWSRAGIEEHLQHWFRHGH